MILSYLYINRLGKSFCFTTHKFCLSHQDKGVDIETIRKQLGIRVLRATYK